MNRDLITLKRGFIIADGPLGEYNNLSAVMTLEMELMRRGFMMEKKLIDYFVSQPLWKIDSLYSNIVPGLATLIGDDRVYEPIYRNFPQEVLMKSDSEILVERIFHYLSEGEWEPPTLHIDKPVKLENPNYKVLKAGTMIDFYQIATDLMRLPYAPTDEDKEILKWFMKNTVGFKELIPGEIPFKETLCMLAAEGYDVPVKTATDVLRIAAYMSWGDTELKLPPKYRIKSVWTMEKELNPERDAKRFRKFSHEEIDMLLRLLDRVATKEEMAKYAKRWVRLGERLHPGYYIEKYPNAFECFQYIRNEKHPRTWYGKLDLAFKESFDKGLEMLQQRPGEFARRLDALLRNAGDRATDVLVAFEAVADKVSVRVLISLITHFKQRTEEYVRSVRIATGKRVTIPELKPMESHQVKTIVDRLYIAIKKNFQNREKLGKVWVDPKLVKIAVPTDMRSMEQGVVAMARGTRIEMGDISHKTLRFYVHWHSKVSNNDLDLSARFINGEITQATDLNYSTAGLKIKKASDIVAVHSGDVRNRIGDNAEYIDIDVAKALFYGYRYVILYLDDFTGRGFDNYTTSVGFMVVDHPESSKIWKPETTQNAFRITGHTTGIIPVIIDLETGEYVLVLEEADDLPIVTFHNISTILNYFKLPEFSLYDIFMMHAARSEEVVVDPDNADIKFTYEDFATNYSKIAEYL